MADVSYSAFGEIAAPVERVYAYRLDFSNLPSYNPNVSNLREVRRGREYVFDLTLAGTTTKIPLRVIEAKRPGRIVVETGPGYMAREVCQFTSTDGGTRLRFDTTLTFPSDLDESSRDLIRTHGLEQVVLEIELMKKNLEA